MLYFQRNCYVIIWGKELEVYLEHYGILNIKEMLYALFLLDIFSWFFQSCSDGRQPTFFIYWFLDGVRSIKEVQKLSRPSWIYISIFIAIYVTNPITDVYKVNNRRHYQCQSNVWAHMGIMRQRSVFEDIDQLPITGFELSFSSPVVKSYPFTTLLWVNKDKIIYPNKFSQVIRQFISHSY